ncbi:MAG: trimeric intracellular cation channel family protein [Candidatus Margulisiibacteriota bacterium]|nr:trimeric intracellular cation channel family protein [Candidatus Margulisiibacteriota bacterium]
MDIKTMVYIIESLGILTFAISGMLLAKKKDMDIVGIYMIGWITAFGGGIIRDVMLDIQPLYWMAHPEYPFILLILAIVMAMLRTVRIKEKWLVIPDAMGMALFATATAQISVDHGVSIIAVGILSTIVATFGGVIRDSLCQEIPLIFRKNSTLYASIAFISGCLYAWIVGLGIINANLALIIISILAFIVRFLSYLNNWKLRF